MKRRERILGIDVERTWFEAHAQLIFTIIGFVVLFLILALLVWNHRGGPNDDWLGWTNISMLGSINISF